MFLRFRSALPLALARTFSLCIDKKKGNDGHSSIGTTIGSEDFPHSTLGKALLQIGIIFLKPHGIALSLHREQETNV